MKESLLDQYKRHFKFLKKQVELLRILLRESGVLDSATDVSEIDGLRQKLLTAFDKEKIAKTHSGANACRCCYYDWAPNYSPIHIYDLAYLLVKNPDFQLPEPDWDNLSKDNPKRCFAVDVDGEEGYAKMYKCLFLGPRGCLYGINRPAACLSHICFGAVKAVMEDSGAEADSKIALAVRGAVLEKIGFPKRFLMGEAVSEWFYRALLPRIMEKTGKTEQEIRLI